MNNNPYLTREHLGTPRTVYLQRDGYLDLQFSGWQLSYAATCNSGDFYPREVTIYLTVGGLYVAQIEHGESSRVRTGEQPEDVLAFLREDYGYLPREAIRAWERACEVYAPLRGTDVEIID